MAENHRYVRLRNRVTRWRLRRRIAADEYRLRYERLITLEASALVVRVNHNYARLRQLERDQPTDSAEPLSE